MVIRNVRNSADLSILAREADVWKRMIGIKMERVIKEVRGEKVWKGYDIRERKDRQMD